jgi:hypothetical protein
MWALLFWPVDSVANLGHLGSTKFAWSELEHRSSTAASMAPLGRSAWTRGVILVPQHKKGPQDRALFILAGGLGREPRGAPRFD